MHRVLDNLKAGYHMHSLKQLVVVSCFYSNNDSVHVSPLYDPNLRFMMTSLAMYVPDTNIVHNQHVIYHKFWVTFK